MTQPAEMLDLDALVPPTVTVRIAGHDYTVPTRDGLPLAAALDGTKLATLDGGAQLDAVISFLDTWCHIPRVVLLGLTPPQLDALFKRIMPPAGGTASADPQQSGTAAQGVDGKILALRAGIGRPPL